MRRREGYVTAERRREEIYVLPGRIRIKLCKGKYWLRVRKNFQNSTIVESVFALTTGAPYHWQAGGSGRGWGVYLRKCYVGWEV